MHKYVVVGVFTQTLRALPKLCQWSRDGVCQLRVLQGDKRGQGGDGNFLRVVRTSRRIIFGLRACERETEGQSRSRDDHGLTPPQNSDDDDE